MSRPIIWATPAHDEIVEVDHEEWVDDDLMDALDGRVTKALIIDEVEVDEDKDVKVVEFQESLNCLVKIRLILSQFL